MEPTFIIFLATLLPFLTANQIPGYPFTFYLSTSDDTKLIRQLVDNGSIRGLPDHITFNSTIAGEAVTQTIIDLLNSTGHVRSLPTAIKYSGLTVSRRNILSTSNQRIPDIFKSYPRFDEITRFLDSLAASNPSLVSLETIGLSYESRQMKVIKIGSSSLNRLDNKPILWIDAGIHAREWIAPVTAVYIAYRLVKDYDVDPVTKSLVDTFDWRILPVANPDGYEYSHTADRMWRKTRSRNNSHSCVGVDANRNFNFHWMESGSSSNPCSEIYAGSKPFSEPESLAIASHLMKHRSRVKLYLTLHSYGQQWLYPWGYAALLTERNDDLQKKASLAASAINSKYGTKYNIGPSGISLYPAAGGSDDWALGVAKIPYSYTVELRPDSESSFDFTLPPDQIIPVGEETWAGVRKLALEIGKDLSKIKRNPGRSSSPLIFRSSRG